MTSLMALVRWARKIDSLSSLVKKIDERISETEKLILRFERTVRDKFPMIWAFLSYSSVSHYSSREYDKETIKMALDYIQLCR